MRLLRFWPFLLVIGLPVAGVAAFAAGLAITDHLEQDNSFCVACHLSEDQPLHQEKYETFFPIEGSVTTLAAAHHGGSGTTFKCVDCHNGATFTDKLQIKAQAARDAVAYLLGDFEEPDRMRFSLGNRLCLACHFTEGEPVKTEKPFHAASHHRQMPQLCTDCHKVHPRASAERRFLIREVVKPLCDECHQRLQ